MLLFPLRKSLSDLLLDETDNDPPCQSASHLFNLPCMAIKFHQIQVVIVTEIEWKNIIGRPQSVRQHRPFQICSRFCPHAFIASSRSEAATSAINVFSVVCLSPSVARRDGRRRPSQCRLCRRQSLTLPCPALPWPAGRSASTSRSSHLDLGGIVATGKSAW